MTHGGGHFDIGRAFGVPKPPDTLVEGAGAFVDLFAGRPNPLFTGDPDTSATSEPVAPTAENLILAVLSANGLTVDFNNPKVAIAFETVQAMLAQDLDTDAIVSFLNQEFALEFAAGELSSLEDASGLSTTDGASRGAGLTEEQLLQLFEKDVIDRGFRVLVGESGARVVNPSGKTIADFVLGEDGLFHPVLGDEEDGGTGAAGARAARDARAVFEDTRDFAEDVFRDRRDFGEDTRRFDLGFGEEVTQSRLSEGRLNRRDTGDLGVALGELNLRMQQHVAQILREPADFLARAFSQRGGESPFPEITQADLINQLRTEFQRIRDFTAEQLGLNSAQIAQLPPPSGDAVDRVATALAPAAELVTKEVQTREAVGGTAAAPTTSPLGFTPTRDALGSEEVETPAPRNPFTTQIMSPLEFDDTERRTATASAPVSEPEPTRISGLSEEEFDAFEHGTKEKNKPGKKGGADNELSLVGEKGPELLINHGDGSFDVVSNEDLFGLLDEKKAKVKRDEEFQNFAEGTLGNLTPDDLGRLSLFDVVDTRTTTQGELESNALLATPPGPASVLSGTKIPDLDVAGGSGFKLFSPQQFEALTPDEQVALRTRLASKNRSLTDFLFASQRSFAGTPRRRPRAVFDVTR
jgi:hypothetical protein